MTSKVWYNSTYILAASPAPVGITERGICRKSLEAERTGCSLGSLNDDQSQSWHSGCHSRGTDILDIVSVEFAKGLEVELARAPEW